jgi:hypothetical protein
MLVVEPSPPSLAGDTDVICTMTFASAPLPNAKLNVLPSASREFTMRPFAS